MNIQTVIDNLKNTIAGKQAMLDGLCPNNPYTVEFMTDGEIMARRATIEFLKVNIAELKRILADVETAAAPSWNQHNYPFVEQCHRID